MDDICDTRNTSSYSKLAKLDAIINLKQGVEGLPDHLQDRQKDLKKNHTYYEAVIKKIIQDSDIDYQIPSDAPIKLHRPELLGCTALHLAVAQRDVNACKVLLDSGANVMIKNCDGHTALHLLLKNHSDIKCRFETLKAEDEVGNLILNAQVAARNGENPSSNDGISHLYIACVYDNTDAVGLLLDKGACINERVSLHSKFVPGYTPLHFAVSSCSLQTVKLLLDRGADKMAADARGLTPLHLMFLHKMEVVDIFRSQELFALRKSELAAHMSEFDDAMRSLVPTNAEFLCARGGSGLTPLHIENIILEESIKFTKDVKAIVSYDSLVFSGYTPLHLAAYFNCTPEFVLEHTTDILAKDTNGITPLDIWLNYADINDVSPVIKTHPKLKDIRFSDGTKLADVIHAMCDIDSFNAFADSELKNINIQVSSDSPLWPGYTILHLAVLFTRKASEGSKNTSSKKSLLYKLMFCFNQNCTIKDANGCTAIDLAANLQNPNDSKFIVDTIAKYYTKNVFNPLERLDSHYIFLTVYNENISTLKRYLKKGGSINSPLTTPLKWYKTGCKRKVIKDKDVRVFVKGSTPLHIAVILEYEDITRLLLQHKADPTLQDDNGMTPMHLAFVQNSMHLVQLLISDPRMVQKSITCNKGLSNLHIACAKNHLHAIETLSKLIEDLNGHVIHSVTDDSKVSANENSAISSFFQKHAGDTPLHFAVRGGSIRIIEFLMKAGGSIFIKNSKGLSPLHLAMLEAITGQDADVLSYFARKFQQKSIEFQDDSGLTMLHLACATLDEKILEAALENDDVNAKIHDDSPILPGCTALHVLASIHRDVDETLMQKMIQMLYDRGASPDIKNLDGRSPVHVAVFAGRGTIVDIFLRCQRDFTVNLTDNEDIYFHIACARKNVEVVENFLQNGADINRATDYFHPNRVAVYTPLHFAMLYGSSAIVETLLMHGSDANARDAYDQTPLQAAVPFSTNMPLEYFYKVQAVISTGGEFDVNARNLLGETLLGTILGIDYTSIKDNFESVIKMLLFSGARVNSRNPVTGENLLPKFFSRCSRKYEVLMRLLDQATDIHCLDEINGYSAIHYAVSTTLFYDDHVYVSVIQRLIEKGCDIDHQDNEGKTALHIAVKTENYSGLAALLALGSDINVYDDTGKTSFQLLYERGGMGRSSRMACFAGHVHKLVYHGFWINGANESIYNEIRHSHIQDDSGAYAEELCKMQRKVVQGSLTMFDLFSKHIVNDYPTLPRSSRERIDLTFKSSDELYREFWHLCCLLHTRYRMARKRLALIEPAQIALDVLAGFGLPEPCSEGIIRHLENDDLLSLMIFSDNYYSVKNKPAER